MLIDLYFIVDIGLNFRTSFVCVGAARPVTQPKDIAINYLRSACHATSSSLRAAVYDNVFLPVIKPHRTALVQTGLA